MTRALILLSTALTISGCGGSGTKGDTGPTGPAGATGPTGTAGPTGMTGGDGQTGPTGVTGATGANGADATANPTPPPAPTRVWINQVGPRHELRWEMPASSVPVASFNIYRTAGSFNQTTDLSESVLAGVDSTDVELNSDTGFQSFTVTAVSAAGIEGPHSDFWTQNTESRIAFAAQSGNSGFNFAWIKSIETGPVPSPVKVETLTASNVTAVVFSPDNMRVAFAGGINNGGDLWVKFADGSGTAIRLNPTVIDTLHGIKNLQWSPDGKYLWYQTHKISDDSEQQLWLADSAVASSAAKIADLPVKNDPNQLEPNPPMFTPDGKRLVYFNNTPGAPTRCDAFVINVALPLGAPTSLSSTLSSPGGANTLFGVVFGLMAPDGKTVALVSVVPNSLNASDYTQKKAEVYLVPLVGTGGSPLVGTIGGLTTNTAAAGWSWDGQAFAFTSDSTGGLVTDELRGATATGSRVYTLLSQAYGEGGAVNVSALDFSTLRSVEWFPDNKHLFVSFTNASGVVDAGGGSLAELDSDSPIAAARVSPAGRYVAKEVGGGGTSLTFDDVVAGGSIGNPDGLASNTNENTPPFRWFPDGDRLLAVDSGGRAVVVHADVPAAHLTALPSFSNTGSSQVLKMQQIDIAPLGYRVQAGSGQ